MIVIFLSIATNSVKNTTMIVFMIGKHKTNLTAVKVRMVNLIGFIVVMTLRLVTMTLRILMLMMVFVDIMTVTMNVMAGHIIINVMSV